MLFNCYLLIAGIRFQLESDYPLVKSREFEPFFTDTIEQEIHAVIRKAGQLPDVPENVMSVDAHYKVVLDNQGNTYSFFFENAEKPIYYAAAACDASGKEIVVEYLESHRPYIADVKRSFFHLGFASILLHRNKLCLHASCVDTPLGGILFSGVSGIGKSTQAELWCRYRGARQINGDRPILSKEGQTWLAWGSPYAGSSKVYVNDSCPVSAIVLLKQAKACSLRRLSPSEAFRGVWAGLTIHSWDAAFVEKASALAVELIQTVPVYEFSCTPDETAVVYLEQILRKELKL